MAGPAALRAMEIADQAERHFDDPSSVGKLFIPNIMGRASLPANNPVGFGYDSVEEAFPNVEPRLIPLGDYILVMIRVPKMRSAGGIELQAEDRRTEFDNTQVAKVIAVGPMAFKWQRDGSPWPEGDWCAVGDFVRIPKYQGDRMSRSYQRKDFEIVRGERRETVVTDYVHFVQFKHNQLLGKYPDAESALAERAFF
jgi:co-chaperonin GroES (HSP10)